MKTYFLKECLNCPYFFIKKIQSNSSVSILQNGSSLEDYLLDNKNKINLNKIIKEEIFFHLSAISKHNLGVCKRISGK